MPFKLTGYCRLRSKNGIFKPRNIYGFTATNGVTKKMRLQDISARKAICSQLETFETRA